MELFALSPTQLAGGQIALAAILATAGFALLLPNPRGRVISGGIAALVAAAVVFVVWLIEAFGRPMPDLIGTILFWLFAAGAIVFGTVLVVQRNPARGAIAFAFVILSTCGLFLLLAAPFLMAATIVIYAGAIIVTFLFVLMLSHVSGPSNENDRSREPLLGGLAGFAFVGLVLFTLHLTHLRLNPPASASEPERTASAQPTTTYQQRLPAPVLTVEEKQTLTDAAARIEAAKDFLEGDPKINREERNRQFEAIKNSISSVVGVSSRDPSNITYGSLTHRLEATPVKGRREPVYYRNDPQTLAVLKQAAKVRELNYQVFTEVENGLLGDAQRLAEAKANLPRLREELLLLSGAGDLPARNVGNLGFLLYADHLLGVELAGTLLLVATIGAIAIAQRKGIAA